MKTLDTITSEHKDFKQVSIHCFRSSLVDIVAYPKWDGGQDWMVLDDALVRLWRLHRICVKVILYSSPKGYKMTEEKYRACLKHVLPGVTGAMEGEIQLELGRDERSEPPPFPNRSKRFGGL